MYTGIIASIPDKHESGHVSGARAAALIPECAYY
jgi:hypothetical protein